MEIIFRISPALVKLIARIERLSGNYEYLTRELNFSDHEPINSHFSKLKTLEPKNPNLIESRYSDKINVFLSSQILADDYKQSSKLVSSNIINQIKQDFSLLNSRDSKEAFQLITREGGLAEVVFNPISPFLIQSRLDEILNWLEVELAQEINHPLMVIGCFHLLFLQVAPYQSANHLLSCFYIQNLLVAQGYLALATRPHFVSYIRNTSGYIRALRQAEKTTMSSWLTLNAWLDFFLHAVLESIEFSLNQVLERRDKELLTDLQKQIIQSVNVLGSATREQVAQHIGVKPATVKYNLSVLCERKYLKRIGAGRTTNYQTI